jgi:4-hydroxyproline epimerase
MPTPPSPGVPIEIIDSHTGGEPTRLVLSGGPPLRPGSCAERLAEFREHFDHYRSAIVNEPRGSDVLVGALLVPPTQPDTLGGVLFFNNVGFLGMCGHGTIGVLASLHHLGRISPGVHRLETPVGIISTVLHPDGRVSLDNVPSYRKAHRITIQIPGLASPMIGDVAWGGNWFFLVREPHFDLSLDRVDSLTDLAWSVRNHLNENGFPEIDHIELFAEGGHGSDSRNFVLCPGKAYDRSPCGTGTSAKLACLAADGVLEEGAPWIQESIVGSRFTASFQWLDRTQGLILPTLSGSAFVTAQASLNLHPQDPFLWGIRR